MNKMMVELQNGSMKCENLPYLDHTKTASASTLTLGHTNLNQIEVCMYLYIVCA